MSNVPNHPVTQMVSQKSFLRNWSECEPITGCCTLIISFHSITCLHHLHNERKVNDQPSLPIYLYKLIQIIPSKCQLLDTRVRYCPHQREVINHFFFRTMKVNPLSCCFRHNAVRADNAEERDKTRRIICRFIAVAVLAVTISSVVYLSRFKIGESYFLWWSVIVWSMIICLAFLITLS